MYLAMFVPQLADSDPQSGRISRFTARRSRQRSVTDGRHQIKKRLHPARRAAEPRREEPTNP